MNLGKNLRKQTHGTATCYKNGCRCKQCKYAHKLDIQQYRTKHRLNYNNYMRNFQKNKRVSSQEKTPTD